MSFFSILSLTFLLALPAPAASAPTAETNTSTTAWRVALPTDQYPYSDHVSLPEGEEGQLAGLSVDWWRSLAELAEVDVRFFSCPSEPDCRTSVANGDADFAGPLPFVDDARFLHTRPVMRRHILALTPPDEDQVAGPPDIADRQIAAFGLCPLDLEELAKWRPASVERTGSWTTEQWQSGTGGKVAVYSFAPHREHRLMPQSQARSLWFRWLHVVGLAVNDEVVARIDALADRIGPRLTPIERKWLPIQARPIFLESDARPEVSVEALTLLRAHPTIRLGAALWEPLTVFRGGQFDGLALRIVKHHYVRSGMTPIFGGRENWREVVAEAKADKYDGLGYVITPSTTHEHFALSQAFQDLPVVVVARSDAPFWAEVGDLHNRSVAANPDYRDIEAIAERQGLKLTRNRNPAKSLALLRSGEVDAWVEYLPIARHAIGQVDARDVKLAFQLKRPSVLRTALQPRLSALIPLLNQSVSNTRRESVDQIVARWNEHMAPPAAGAVAYPILVVIIALMLIGLLLLLRHLRRANRSSRQRESAMRRAQILSRVGSFEIPRPYDKILLDGETPHLLGLGPNDPDQPIAKHIALFERPEDIRYAIERVKTSERPVELDVVSRSCPPRTYRYELNPPSYVAGRDGVISGTLQDITEKKARMEQQKALEQQVLQLQKQDAIGQLARGIAHDFNNVLAASIGYNELALAELGEHHPARFYMQQVLQASHRSRDLVRQILAASTHHTQEHQTLRWDQSVTETLDFLRASLPTTVRLREEVGPAPIWVKGDKTQLSQILLNLVTNAVDAVSSEGTITVTLTQNSVDAQLTVTDDGKGIDPAVKDQIFDPFFTTKPSGRGTGLGLSIVHGVVRAHQGTVEVDSDQGKFTKFVVTLPVSEDPLTATDPSVRSRVAHGKRVMVVDDEPDLIVLFERILTSRGFVVKTFQSPLEALAALETQGESFDVIVTDRTMPDMTGVEFARRVRQDDPTARIILISGYGIDSASRASGLFCSTLDKPISSDDLVAAVIAAAVPPCAVPEC